MILESVRHRSCGGISFGRHSKKFVGLVGENGVSGFKVALEGRNRRCSIIARMGASRAKSFKYHKVYSFSHLFYADDAVFVGQWCENNINTLVYVLECFFRASGLRINMARKQELMGSSMCDSGQGDQSGLPSRCLTKGSRGSLWSRVNLKALIEVGKGWKTKMRLLSQDGSWKQYCKGGDQLPGNKGGV
ncbi:hypothetical protein Tco_0724627 [Tanacetum coccineum]